MAKRIPKLTLLQIDRFWKRVDRSRGPDACWLWTGYLRDNGYGVSEATVSYVVHGGRWGKLTRGRRS